MCFFFFVLRMGWLVFFFFFSSRRRHTRCGRDWSSDVCSSDLGDAFADLTQNFYRGGPKRGDTKYRSGLIVRISGDVVNVIAVRTEGEICISKRSDRDERHSAVGCDLFGPKTLFVALVLRVSQKLAIR